MTTKDVQMLDEYLNALFEKKKLPGMSVVVRGPDGILFEKGYGYRDMEHGCPVDEDTVFGIASMSKSMTALSCAILQLEGRLSLEDPISKYFPDLHIPGIYPLQRRTMTEVRSCTCTKRRRSLNIGL